jgi:hypothetical protein
VISDAEFAITTMTNAAMMIADAPIPYSQNLVILVDMIDFPFLIKIMNTF